MAPSPREVDEVLLDHPAVARAVTFATPREKFREEVARSSREDDALAESALRKTK
jgi:acyl-coenzyme A synthetase/AMP-(fatty) acid ligase